MANVHDGSKPHAGRSSEECEQLIAELLKSHPDITPTAYASLSSLEPCDRLRVLQMACDTLDAFDENRTIN